MRGKIRRRQKLVSPGLLLMLAGLLATILAALFPADAIFNGLGTRPDELSLSYLRLGVGWRPGDTRMRLRLARQLLSAGKLHESREALGPLLSSEGGPDKDRIAIQARMLALRIDTHIAGEMPPGDARREGELKMIGEEVRTLTREALSPEEAEELGQVSLSISRPDLAAELYLHMAAGADPAGRRAWLPRAARHFLSSGQAGRAAELYDQLATPRPDPRLGRKYAILALEAFMAGDRGRAGLLRADLYLRRFPGDVLLLRTAVKLGLSQNAVADAQRWGRQLYALRPRDPEIIARQLDIELLARDMSAAFHLVERLTAIRPRDLQARVRLARIAEWADRPEVALLAWAVLARKSPLGPYADHAIRLAADLDDFERMAEMLALKAHTRRLSAAEITSLADVYEAIGRPEAAIDLLTDYLARFPGQKEAWEALAFIQERRGDLPGSLLTRNSMGARFGSKLKDVTHKAALLWRLERSTEAFALLRDAMNRAGVPDSDRLAAQGEIGKSLEPRRRERRPHPGPPGAEDSTERLLSELLGELEDHPEVLSVYRELWKKGALDTDSVEHFLNLLRSAGREEEAMGIAEGAYVRTGRPQFLLFAMEAALHTRRFQDLGRLLELGKHEEERFAESKAYWILRAQLKEHQGELGPAEQAYRRALSLDPECDPARAGILWLLIRHKDKAGLRRALRRWRQDATQDPALFRAYATGFSLLGDARQAVRWFEREWRSRPAGDHEWLIGYAEALEQVHRNRAASALRRYALRQLRPEAIAAAHRAPTEEEQDLLGTYAQLVRDSFGAGKGRRWLRPVLGKDLDPPLARELVASWRSSDEVPEPETYWQERKPPARHHVHRPRWHRQSDPRQDLNEELSGQGGEEDDRPGPRVASFDEPAPEGLSRYRSYTAGVEAKGIGSLLVLGAVTMVDLVRGPFGLQLRLAYNQLFSPVLDLELNQQSEVELSLRGKWQHRHGFLELGLGGNLRGDHSVMSGWLNQEYRLFPGGLGRAELNWNEVVDETPFLRALGVRNRVLLSLNAELSKREFIGVEADLHNYYTRGGDILGEGYAVEAEAGYHLRLQNPEWTLRVTGAYMQNRLADSLPRGVYYLLPPGTTVADVVTPSYATAGVGTSVQRGLPGGAPAGGPRLRYVADLWLGWLWPVNLFGYDVRAGVGMSLPARGDLSLTGFVTNNQWGGRGQVNWGLGLRYVY